MEQRPVIHREWWQTCSMLAFREEVKRLGLSELQSLSTEIKGAVAVTQGQIQGRDRETAPLEWLRRAQKALGYLSEKKHIIGAELESRNRKTHGTRIQRVVEKQATSLNSRQWKDAQVLEAQGCLDRDDLRGAIERILLVLRRPKPDDPV